MVRAKRRLDTMSFWRTPCKRLCIKSMFNHNFHLFSPKCHKTRNQTGFTIKKRDFKCYMIISLLMPCFAFLFRFGSCDKLITISYAPMTANHNTEWYWIPLCTIPRINRSRFRKRHKYIHTFHAKWCAFFKNIHKYVLVRYTDMQSKFTWFHSLVVIVLIIPESQSEYKYTRSHSN